MRVRDLKEMLEMFPDDMAVHIQTTPNDLTQPVTMKQVSIIKAWVDTSHGGCSLNPAFLLFTAYHPHGKSEVRDREAPIAVTDKEKQS